MTKYNAEEFYPTPKELLEKITGDILWGQIKYVLEPSAGAGNIASFVKEKCKNITTKSGFSYQNEVDIDCIEIDPELQSVLSGKGFRVIHDNFLTFNGFKNYDLIIMNPPFSEGEKHLKKALSLMRPGCALVCILNAETIKNPFSNERKELIRNLNELNVSIEYMQNEFSNAERTTNVEIAVIKLIMPEEKEMDDFIFDYLKKQQYIEFETDQETSLTIDDYIANAVLMYQLETEAGIKLIHDYKKLLPHLEDSITEKKYSKPMLELKCDGYELSENAFVRKVREKYWNALFRNEKFTGNMTSNLKENYTSKVKELEDYDFSLYNIRHLQIKMSKELIGGIEQCILKLFDELSCNYSWNEFSSNIHYYNGWHTNKSWYINQKVILPYMNAWCQISNTYNPTDYRLLEKLQDIEKALRYLDGKSVLEQSDLPARLREAKNNNQTKNIDTKYFTITFYKKGTCHIVFKDERLLKKLNIFGSQQKKWLPPGYGKKAYNEFTDEEKAVINEFDGGNANYEMDRNNNLLFASQLCLPTLSA